MDRCTIKCLCFGIAAGILLMLPSFNYYYDLQIPFTGFPLGLLAQGAGYMTVFFHEIGHTVFYWLYGYVAVPRFDFEYGGGYSNAVTGQMYVLLAAVYGGTAYLIYLAREEKIWLFLFLPILALHLLTAFNDYHHAVIGFMGHGTELAIGSFMICRALLNAAPRGIVERWLNSLFGFFFIFKNMRDFTGLMTSDVEREAYANQKGGLHLGDLSSIARDYLNIQLESVACFGLIFALIALLVPFVIYWHDTRRQRIEKLLIK